MKVTQSPNTSALYLWNGVSAIFFSSSVTPFHSHNTLQIVFDIQTGFKLRLKKGLWKLYKNLIIKENVVHQLDTKNSVQLIIYIDTETTLAKAIKARYLLEEIYAPDLNLFQFVKPGELQNALLHADAVVVEKLVERILHSLATPSSDSNIDERINVVQEIIANESPGLLSIKYLAAQVYISESRLRALFKQTTGIALYRYILWSKIRFATTCLLAGSSVHDAALKAGFVDSSHFHKVMIRMFGISPSTFINSNKAFKVIESGSSPLNVKTVIYEG
jgi:AraC-like DNA-binding protein